MLSPSPLHPAHTEADVAWLGLGCKRPREDWALAPWPTLPQCCLSGLAEGSHVGHGVNWASVLLSGPWALVRNLQCYCDWVRASGAPASAQGHRGGHQGLEGSACLLAGAHGLQRRTGRSRQRRREGRSSGHAGAADPGRAAERSGHRGLLGPCHSCLCHCGHCPCHSRLGVRSRVAWWTGWARWGPTLR